MFAARKWVGAAVVSLALAMVGGPATAKGEYTISIGAKGSYAYPTDTPASTYTDKDGKFYFQQSAALYGAKEPREWGFYSGKDFETARPDPISTAVNPADSQDRNNDTTKRCNNSPTGLEATSAGSGSGYSQRNFCDLVGVWVDPDTGDWYGLVHNEFTPQPFGDGLHYDSLDYAVSTDQGKVWTIKGHAITSPYSTIRGDTRAFPNGTYDYGDGDPRLFVDAASGYFYVYYGSRVVPKAGTGGSTGGLAHVARAPLSAKMATGSWSKWYDGSWSQPGIGGRESTMVPVSADNPRGYTPVAHDYNPANAGTVDQQVAENELPAKSDLFIMNIAYDAYLGLYIGEPEVVSGTAPQRFYVTDSLATQKWSLIGDSGSYVSGSWYRWFIDNVNKTNSTVIGKTFRSYCSIACASSDGEYADITVDSSSAPAPLNPHRAYRIGNANGQMLTQTAGRARAELPTLSTFQDWFFVTNGDGSYRIVNARSGGLLGVDARSNAGRAWGAVPTVTAAGQGRPSSGQQWFVLASRTANGAATGSVRLVNRYSGLVLGMSTDGGHHVETVPTRSWTDRTHTVLGGFRTAAAQSLRLTPVGR